MVDDDEASGEKKGAKDGTGSPSNSPATRRCCGTSNGGGTLAMRESVGVGRGAVDGANIGPRGERKARPESAAAIWLTSSTWTPGKALG